MRYALTGDIDGYKQVIARLDRAAKDYCETILSLPDMLEWIEAAKAEPAALEELEAEF